MLGEQCVFHNGTIFTWTKFNFQSVNENIQLVRLMENYGLEQSKTYHLYPEQKHCIFYLKIHVVFYNLLLERTERLKTTKQKATHHTLEFSLIFFYCYLQNHLSDFDHVH